MQQKAPLSQPCHLYPRLGYSASSSVQEHISNSSKDKVSLYAESIGNYLHFISRFDSIIIDLNIKKTDHYF